MDMLQLQPNATLQDGKYIIKKVLGQGGFGITYLAEHDLLGTKVAIKEFFMKDFCNRDCDTSHVMVGTDGGREQVVRFKEKFIKEARNIARLRHPNIVRISDVFEENGTAYYVMDYCDGGSLSELLKLHKDGLEDSLALNLTHQVASALGYIHEEKMMHLDVKPANILLDRHGNAVLIDFGLSKQYDAMSGSQTSTTPVGISHGYAPIEQYKQGGVSEFSPATDIYSLGATLYSLITGKTPPDAQVLLDESLPYFKASKGVTYAICKSTQPRKKDRPQTISEFLSLLDDGDSSDKQDISIEKQKKALEEQIEEKTIEEKRLFDEESSIDNEIIELQTKLSQLQSAKKSIYDKRQNVTNAIRDLTLQLQKIVNPVETESLGLGKSTVVAPDPICLFKLQIEAADYSSLPVEQFEDMNEAILDLLRKGYKAEAGKYYMDQTGLGVDDAIDYLDFVEKKEDSTKLI